MIYTIKKDTNNDTKFRIPDILTGKFKKTWKVSLSPECWYPKELGYNQINKLVGVTEFWSANNKNSVMVGWDPCYLPEEEILEKYPHCKNLTANIKEVKYFNIYYYENDGVGGHKSRFWTVIADWHINDLMVTQSTIEKNEYTLRMLETKIEIVQFSGGGIANPNTIWTQPTTETDLVYYTVRTAFKYSFLREIFIWFGGTKKAPWNMLFKVN